MPSIRLERGTKGWHVKKFKELLVPALLRDLEAREQDGLMDQVCERVQQSLKGCLASATRFTPLFRDEDTLEVHVRAFSDLYFNWNNHPKEHIDFGREHRRRYLRELRLRRDQLSETVMDNVHALAEKAEESAAKDICESLAQLSRELPSIFPNLRHATRLFDRRKSSN